MQKFAKSRCRPKFSQQNKTSGNIPLWNDWKKFHCETALSYSKNVFILHQSVNKPAWSLEILAVRSLQEEKVLIFICVLASIENRRSCDLSCAPLKQKSKQARVAIVIFIAYRFRIVMFSELWKEKHKM